MEHNNNRYRGSFFNFLAHRSFTCHKYRRFQYIPWLVNMTWNLGRSLCCPLFLIAHLGCRAAEYLCHALKTLPIECIFFWQTKGRRKNAHLPWVDVPRLYMFGYQKGFRVNRILYTPWPSQNRLPWQIQLELNHHLM